MTTGNEKILQSDTQLGSKYYQQPAWSNSKYREYEEGKARIIVSDPDPEPDPDWSGC